METTWNASKQQDRVHVERLKAAGGTIDVPNQRAIVAALALAGIAGPILFTVLVVAQGLVHPDYSHVALPISALAAWLGGWVQNVNFVILGALKSAYAIGLHLGVRQGRGGVIGPALLVLSGVGLVVAGAFPWSTVGGNFIVPAGHIVGALLSFLGAGSGFIALSPRLAGDPQWRSLAAYTLTTGVAIVALFFVLFAFARLPEAPLHLWAGLVQRLAVAVWFACTMILGFRLLRLSKKADGTRKEISR